MKIRPITVQCTHIHAVQLLDSPLQEQALRHQWYKNVLALRLHFLQQQEVGEQPEVLWARQWSSPLDIRCRERERGHVEGRAREREIVRNTMNHRDHSMAVLKTQHSSSMPI